ncbi:MAG: OmpA family protein [Crocinitomicaceae bacterium]|nr:OmpA family protein [Crocinitomicaceae bacterium]
MKFKFILTLSLLFSTSLLMAQGKDVEKANDAFRSEKFCDAAELCSKAYTKIPSKKRNAKKKKGRMAFQAAESYRFTEQYKEANEWYDRCILLEYEEINPEIYYFNAEMLRMMRDFDKAKENYEKYKELVPEDDRANTGIESCNRVKEYIAEKTRHMIENEKIINVNEFDMAPMFGDRKMKKMYYSSARDGSTGKDIDPRSCEKYMDIWVAELDKKGNWKKPTLVNGEGINTVDNEGTVCFDDRKKKMFFTRCPNMKKQNLGCDIWVSTAKGRDSWNEPTKLIGLKPNDSTSVGHPCTKDGKYLIFASDMIGGYGGRDLWYTQYDRKSETWSAPKNMGPEINTKGDELFPTFALNGDLIFATNGRAGMGGLDLFRAEKVSEDENKWQNPKNFGAPINSVHNDYALVEMTDRKGYFTSERKESSVEGRPDIFSYEMPPNLFSLKVIVSDQSDKTIKLEDVKVTVKDSKGGTWEGYTNEDGSVYWDKKPSGDRYVGEEMSYSIDIAKEGYYENPSPFDITTVSLTHDQDFVVDMGLFPIAKPINLPEMQYIVNTWEFVIDSTINSPDSLEYVYELLVENPGLELELSSHTDSRGRNSANQKLSENRARRCYKYLVEEKGIDPRRIVPVGKGEDEPRTVFLMDGKYLAKEPMEEGAEYQTIVLKEAYINKFRRSKPDVFKLLHQMNRRTEGKIITLKFDPETAPEADPKLLEYVKYP